MSGFFSLFLRVCPVFFPFIMGIIKYRQLNKGLKLFFFQICFWVFSEAIAIILSLTKGENTWYLNIYVPVEFLMFALMYAWFLKDIIRTKYFYIIITVFISYSIFNTFFIRDFYLDNYYLR